MAYSNFVCEVEGKKNTNLIGTIPNVMFFELMSYVHFTL